MYIFRDFKFLSLEGLFWFKDLKKELAIFIWYHGEKTAYLLWRCEIYFKNAFFKIFWLEQRTFQFSAGVSAETQKEETVWPSDSSKGKPAGGLGVAVFTVAAVPHTPAGGGLPVMASKQHFYGWGFLNACGSNQAGGTHQEILLSLQICFDLKKIS